MTVEAGFVRARILAPFEPGTVSGSPVPEHYQAPSLLVAALPYGNCSIKSDAVGCETGSIVGVIPAGEGAARIAPFARRNYYREAVKRLQKLSVAFRSWYGGKKADFRILCNSPVPEKPLAVACGLGSVGRNSLIITPEAGSLVIIAAMTLPFTLKRDEQGNVNGTPFPRCRGCDPLAPPCVQACPTGALRGDGIITLNHCIQWYASGKGDTVPPEVARKWGNRLYGCTECQDACIHNQRPIQGVQSEEGPLPAYLDAKELCSLTEGELKARFKGTAMGLSWLGPEGIRRNAELVLKTYHKIIF
jgi:epoxyqueuosine reductase